MALGTGEVKTLIHHLWNCTSLYSAGSYVGNGEFKPTLVRKGCEAAPCSSA